MKGAVLALAIPPVLLLGATFGGFTGPKTQYDLKECGPDRAHSCPSDLNEDAPLWDCTSQGNLDCGPTRVTRYEDGSYIIHYSNGELVVDHRGNRSFK